MQYKETLDWMFGKLPMYQRVGGAAYKADLQQTIDLLNLLDNPQNRFKAVHIAGTNGKGSVSHLLASVLQEAGYKTALYTSPHLKDFRERIRINGKMISEEAVMEFIAKYRDKFEEMQLSFFEMTVGMAFDYFAKEHVDIAIVETGMGGRLDSTNLLQPLLSVITNIGYDHMQFLGNSLEEIAAEKGGIIKESVPVVIGESSFSTDAVFKQIAEERHALITFADTLYDARKLNKSVSHLQYFDIWKDNILYLEDLALPLLGLYQQKNIVTVLAALEILSQSFEIEEQHIRDGFETVVHATGFMGRWQVLSRKPLMVADTGHNREGIIKILTQLQSIPYDRLHFVLGMVNDKNISDILSLLPQHAKYYFCKANIPRALPAEELAEKAAQFSLQGEVYDSVTAAWHAAKNDAKDEDVVFVGGSTFVVAEVV